MTRTGREQIVFLGMMTKIPVGGAVWGTMQYLVGFERLGYDVYYVEAHARTPSMFMVNDDDDSSALAAEYLSRLMERFGFADRWAFHALHDDGRCYGMSAERLRELYRSAALIINYHGGTVPLPEHVETGRLVYLETDPVELEIELHNNDPAAIAFLEPHRAFFTWAQNYGHSDCRVPVPERFPFRPTLPPVVNDLWEPFSNGAGESFTTIGNWRQPWRDVVFEGEVYHWSKHHEFLKVIDLPRRTPQPFELALGSYEPADKQLLEDHGWRVHDSLDVSVDLDAYRHYICHSRGEFTVAKDQNVRLRSGWFSERSAQYLAAGRPVITQETGFSNSLPTGEGLFGFSSTDDILDAVEAINSDYARHSRAAREIAREHFSYEVVLRRLLDEAGL
jgi:hypothetical protein